MTKRIEEIFEVGVRRMVLIGRSDARQERRTLGKRKSPRFCGVCRAEE